MFFYTIDKVKMNNIILKVLYYAALIIYKHITFLIMRNFNFSKKIK